MRTIISTTYIRRRGTYYVLHASSSRAPTNRCAVFEEIRYMKKNRLYMTPWAPRTSRRVNRVGWATVKKVLGISFSIIRTIGGAGTYKRCILSFSASSNNVWIHPPSLLYSSASTFQHLKQRWVRTSNLRLLR